MALVASLDPLYPLKGQPVAREVLEMVEVDIYQYLMSITGKVATFKSLQVRFEKHNFNRMFLTVVLIMVLLLLISEFILRLQARYRALSLNGHRSSVTGSVQNTNLRRS